MPSARPQSPTNSWPRRFFPSLRTKACFLPAGENPRLNSSEIAQLLFRPPPEPSVPRSAGFKPSRTLQTEFRGSVLPSRWRAFLESEIFSVWIARKFRGRLFFFVDRNEHELGSRLSVGNDPALCRAACIYVSPTPFVFINPIRFFARSIHRGSFPTRSQTKRHRPWMPAESPIAFFFGTKLASRPPPLRSPHEPPSANGVVFRSELPNRPAAKGITPCSTP